VIALRNRTDEELLARDADPANAAFAAFYERYEGVVIAYFLRRVRVPEVAADLASETFAQALASRSRFRRGRGSAVAWLFGIAHHVWASSARRGEVDSRARRKLGITPLELDDTTMALIEELASDVAVAQALERLPAEQRDAVRARVLEDGSYDEIAAELQCSPAVVRKRVSRGLAGLRAHLEEPA